MTLLKRVQSPTTKFFKSARIGGLLLVLLAASILCAPFVLPPRLFKIAGNLTVAPVVTNASQVLTYNDEPLKPDHYGT